MVIGDVEGLHEVFDLFFVSDSSKYLLFVLEFCLSQVKVYIYLCTDHLADSNYSMTNSSGSQVNKNRLFICC